MKTQTRTKLLEYLGKHGTGRPTDLAQILNISPQALHRHLKALVQSGAVEAKGHPPFTSYSLSGIPDFSSVVKWVTNSQTPVGPPSFVCETRDVFSACLSSFKNLLKQGLPTEDLPLVIAITGEIGNNSFDHNLGQWRDIPGCWFENQITGGRLWICIADRGQGIYASLSRVDKTIQNDQAALEIAFEKQISGRAPELRGNGLKYVKNVITAKENRGLVCFSGHGRIHFGEQGNNCQKIFDTDISSANGTVTLISWRFK